MQNYNSEKMQAMLRPSLAELSNLRYVPRGPQEVYNSIRAQALDRAVESRIGDGSTRNQDCQGGHNGRRR